MFKMRQLEEAKEVVELQRAAFVYKLIVYKHIVGICSTLIVQSEGLAVMLLIMLLKFRVNKTEQILCVCV